MLDLGCGDGRAAARLAAREPNALVIGVDANLDAAERVIHRSRRAPEKGGLENLVLVRAAADRLPPELARSIDELRIDLPWGSLLSGLVAGNPDLFAGIHAVLAPGGQVRIVINPRALPGDVSHEDAAAGLRQNLEAAGFSEVRVEDMAIEPETGWAKRLSGRRPLPAIVAEGRKPAG